MGCAATEDALLPIHPTSWIRVNHVSLRYELVGRGSSTVVLLHESNLTMESWDYVLPAILPRRRVLRYDLRGFGLSEKLPGGTITMDDQIEDLRALLDALNISGPVSLAGGAIGANIALVFTARYPERVKAVIAVSAFITLGVKSPGSPPGDWFERVYPAVLRTNPERWERFCSMCAAADRASFAATIDMNTAFDYAPVLPKIQAPVLVIATSLYKLMPLEMIKAVADAIPRGRLEILETGHFAAIESPDLVARALLHFLDEVGG